MVGNVSLQKYSKVIWLLAAFSCQIFKEEMVFWKDLVFLINFGNFGYVHTVVITYI